MKNLLMVSYCYPPMGSPGALRSVKFAKYLPDSGWSPVVVTPRAGYSRVEGLPEERTAEVRTVRTADLGSAKRALAGAAPRAGGVAAAGRRRWLMRAVQALAIPDRDITWYPFALAAGLRAVRRYDVDAVYSTSPSITNHLVAGRISRLCGLPWIADFRDAWTLAPGYAAQGVRRAFELRLERDIVDRASRVVVVSESIRQRFVAAYPHAADRFATIHNGFDDADFAALPAAPAGSRFVLTYAGTFYGGGRDPRGLFGALARLRVRGVLSAQNFALQVLGTREASLEQMANEAGVGDLVRFEGPLPYHAALAKMVESAALLVITHTDEASRGELTTKLFEYMGAGRPILALTPPDFELAAVVRRAGVGTSIHPGDVDGIASWLEARVGVRDRGPEPAAAPAEVARYSRREGARKLAGLLDSLGSRPGRGRHRAPAGAVRGEGLDV